MSVHKRVISVQKRLMSLHVPGALHPPDTKSIAESLMRHVATTGGEILHLRLVTPQYLEQEVYVATRKLQGLDLAEFVRRECRDDLPQLGEGVVERLCPLSLSHVSQASLCLQLLRALWGLAADLVALVVCVHGVLVLLLLERVLLGVGVRAFAAAVEVVSRVAPFSVVGGAGAREILGEIEEGLGLGLVRCF